MNSTLFLAGWALLFAEGGPAPLRYVRPQGDGYAKESEVAGLGEETHPSTYSSQTFRGKGVTTLTIRRGKDGTVRSATVRQVADPKKSPAGTEARLTLEGGKARLRQGERVATFAVEGDPVVTTAPDWSDIFQLVRRYDGKKAGKQSFPGVWIHPTRPHRLLAFTVERVGTDAVSVGKKKETLTRYAITLRSGKYTVWARTDRRVCKILPGRVILEGYQEAVRDLK